MHSSDRDKNIVSEAKISEPCITPGGKGGHSDSSRGLEKAYTREKGSHDSFEADHR